MLNIFEFNEGKIGLTTDFLSHPVFKALYDRDTDPHKGEALMNCNYLNYYCSPKKTNPFFGYNDLEERHYKIIKSLYKRQPDLIETKLKEYAEDTLLTTCVEILNDIYENASPTLRLYNDCAEAAKRVGTFIRTIDLEATTNSGAAKYKPADVTSAINDAEAVAVKLNNLKNIVDSEITEAVKTIKNRGISYFEQVENADK